MCAQYDRLRRFVLAGTMRRKPEMIDSCSWQLTGWSGSTVLPWVFTSTEVTNSDQNIVFGEANWQRTNLWSSSLTRIKASQRMMPLGTFAGHPGWIPTPVFWSWAVHVKSPDVEWYTYLTHSELLEEKKLIQHRLPQTYSVQGKYHTTKQNIHPFQYTEKNTTTIADAILLQMSARDSEYTQIFH